ncbi:MAG: efflux RND transporter permease subunit, partial [bacterium]|nr:efflux RND transporter permease subunit [bacterium]
ITLPLMIIILKPQIPLRVTLLFRILFFIGAVATIIILAPKNIILPFIVIAYFILLYILIVIRRRFNSKVNSINEVESPVSKVWGNIKKYTDKPILGLDTVAIPYKRILLRILDSKSARIKVIVAITLFALTSYALVPLGLVKNEFFPKTDEDLIFINTEFPSGSNIDTMSESTNDFMKQIQNTKNVDFVSANIGQSAGGEGGMGNQSVVGYTIHLEKKSVRTKSSMDIAQELREKFQNYDTSKVSVIEESGGPPAGADLQITVSGEDNGVVDWYAEKLVEYLKERKGVTNVSKSLKSGLSQLVFSPDSSLMLKNDITTAQVASAVRLYTSGLELDKVKLSENNNEEQLVLLKVAQGSPTVDDLGKITIKNNNGELLPLNALGKFELQPSPSEINREDRKRIVTVTAGVSPQLANTTQEGVKLEQFADNLNLPKGYGWKTGGVNEENAKSVESIIQAMGLAFILILVTMVVQFGSFRQAFIALAVIPLAISSVFFVFALTGTPLSFPALIGILALFGIIVTNSMFIIDKININRKNGMLFKEAIADAGYSRLEPIVLTKLCTILGLLPITIAQPLWRGLGGAIISGVLLASTFMLLFIPVVYYSFFAKSEEEKDRNRVLV